jgi:hypothetical protein
MSVGVQCESSKYPPTPLIPQKKKSSGIRTRLSGDQSIRPQLPNYFRGNFLPQKYRPSCNVKNAKALRLAEHMIRTLFFQNQHEKLFQHVQVHRDCRKNKGLNTNTLVWIENKNIKLSAVPYVSHYYM